MKIPFQHTYSNLPEHFYEQQFPAKVPQATLIRVNHELAKELSLDPAWLESADGLAMLSGNQPPDNAHPISQVYAGHQFGGFSPRLGDGRAILLGELLNQKGERCDLQLKGSGRTPFSRGGDGKSALGPVLREYIVSEAMFALGVPTTRALAAVTTGESVLRQEGSLPGGVFTRIAASHIRVGTFQYFLAQQDHEAVKTLADYTIARHYPEAQSYLDLLDGVISAQAKLVAHWMALGFIHGVMNTDNTAISGETIDFGPCAFMDNFHPQKTFSSIDQGGRYSWGHQASIAHWNLTRFAETLIPLMDPDSDEAVALAKESLSKFGPQFQEHYLSSFTAKLCLPETAPKQIIDDCLKLLTTHKIDFTLFFRTLTRATEENHPDDLFALFSEKEDLKIWYTNWKNQAAPNDHLDLMKKTNPVIIPRNHRIEEAIQSAYDGDFSRFHRLVDALSQPYAERIEYDDLESPPKPEEIVHSTFCGT